MGRSCYVQRVTTRGRSSLWIQFSSTSHLLHRCFSARRGQQRHLGLHWCITWWGASEVRLETFPLSSDGAGGHAVGLQAGRGGGGEGAVHDGTERLVGPEGFSQSLLLLGQRVYLMTESTIKIYFILFWFLRNLIYASNVLMCFQSGANHFEHVHYSSQWRSQKKGRERTWQCVI